MNLKQKILGIWAPRVSSRKKTPPNPEGTRDAFARIGYSLEEAIGDLVDNSIDAKADEVVIRFITKDNSVSKIVIADSGHGMAEKTLDAAMQFGAKMPHKRPDLGKYGIGMKSASFSQGDIVTVITKHRGYVCGRRWSKESIDDGWYCESLNNSDCQKILGLDWGVDLVESGTVVIWDDLHQFRNNSTGVVNAINKASDRIAKHLGVIFHRFLGSSLKVSIGSTEEDSGESGLDIPILPLNPFDYPISGHPGFPKKYTIEMENLGKLNLTAHIWPQKSKAPGYRLGGGKVAERQGLYFYRNDRLIQTGGWNGLREAEAEPHLSLARVEIDLPPSFDHEFALNVQKTKVIAPRRFADKTLSATTENINFKEYLALAQEAYRSKPTPTDYPYSLGNGYPPKLRKISKKIFKDDSGKTQNTGIKWSSLEKEKLIDVDRKAKTILLNSKYHKLLVGSSRTSVEDIPLIKALLFLLLSEELKKNSNSPKFKGWLQNTNKLLHAAAKK